MNTRGPRFWSTTALSGVIVVALAGCGGSGKPKSSGPSASAAAIRRAADVSEAAKGYRVQLSIRERVPGSASVDTSMAGSFSVPGPRATMAFNVSADGKTERIREIILGTTIYMKLPAAETAKLPGGKPWLKLDLSKVGKNSTLSSVAALVSSPTENDPAQSFAYLRGEATHLTDLGAATVFGHATTHYRAVVDLRKAGAGQPPQVHAAIQALLRKLGGRILNETAMPMDVWIDSSHLVRKMQYDFKFIPEGSTQTVDASSTLTMTAYGSQPSPEAPPASQTANFLTLAKQAGQTGAR